MLFSCNGEQKVGPKPTTLHLGSGPISTPHHLQPYQTSVRALEIQRVPPDVPCYT